MNFELSGGGSIWMLKPEDGIDIDRVIFKRVRNIGTLNFSNDILIGTRCRGCVFTTTWNGLCGHGLGESLL